MLRGRGSPPSTGCRSPGGARPCAAAQEAVLPSAAVGLRPVPCTPLRTGLRFGTQFPPFTQRPCPPLSTMGSEKQYLLPLVNRQRDCRFILQGNLCGCEVPPGVQLHLSTLPGRGTRPR